VKTGGQVKPGVWTLKSARLKPQGKRKLKVKKFADRTDGCVCARTTPILVSHYASATRGRRVALRMNLALSFGIRIFQLRSVVLREKSPCAVLLKGFNTRWS
jgi:hypothetical protein